MLYNEMQKSVNGFQKIFRMSDFLEKYGQRKLKLDREFDRSDPFVYFDKSEKVFSSVPFFVVALMLINKGTDSTLINLYNFTVKNWEKFWKKISITDVTNFHNDLFECYARVLKDANMVVPEKVEYLDLFKVDWPEVEQVYI